jgi:hypothetical protein
MLRRDCVHRNSFDKDRNGLKVSTKAFVRDKADLIKVFVENSTRLCARDRRARPAVTAGGRSAAGGSIARHAPEMSSGPK